MILKLSSMLVGACGGGVLLVLLSGCTMEASGELPGVGVVATTSISCFPGSDTGPVSCTDWMPYSTSAVAASACNSTGDGYLYGTCFVQSCGDGYALINNSCVLNALLQVGPSPALCSATTGACDRLTALVTYLDGSQRDVTLDAAYSFTGPYSGTNGDLFVNAGLPVLSLPAGSVTVIYQGLSQTLPIYSSN